MQINDFVNQIGSLAALDDPVRRRLYLYVVGRGEEVGRDEVAQATGVTRALAAFHLDRLVKAGLLETAFRRLTGKSGPGAGRPSKLYRRAAATIDVSVPTRRYELAAQVLAQTLAGIADEGARERLRDAAREWGGRLARESALASRRKQPLQRATHALEVCGFEPRRTADGDVVLGNCPFASLKAEGRTFICDMNLALIQGLLAGLDLPDVDARLAPRAGLCCVALRQARREG